MAVIGLGPRGSHDTLWWLNGSCPALALGCSTFAFSCHTLIYQFDLKKGDCPRILEAPVLPSISGSLSKSVSLNPVRMLYKPSWPILASLDTCCFWGYLWPPATPVVSPMSHRCWLSSLQWGTLRWINIRPPFPCCGFSLFGFSFSVLAGPLAQAHFTRPGFWVAALILPLALVLALSGSGLSWLRLQPSPAAIWQYFGHGPWQDLKQLRAPWAPLEPPPPPIVPMQTADLNRKPK